VEAQDVDAKVEHIVVDGESDDETPEILAEHEDQIDVLIQEPDDGIFDAMNKGIQAATGEVIGILNADDRWQDSRVLRRVQNAFESTQVEACYGDKALVDGADQVIRYWEAGEHRPWKWLLGWMPPHPTFFVRRDVYERHGVFDNSLEIAADYELIHRFLYREDIDVAYIPEILTRFQLGGNSNAGLKEIAAANKEVHDVWRRMGSPAAFFVPFLKPGRKIFQYLRAVPRRNLSWDLENNNNKSRS